MVSLGERTCLLHTLLALGMSMRHDGAPVCMFPAVAGFPSCFHILAEVHACGSGPRAGPCNFSEEVSCLVTLSVMESSSFHYPHF